jgi:hypothetical protein
VAECTSPSGVEDGIRSSTAINVEVKVEGVVLKRGLREGAKKERGTRE